MALPLRRLSLILVALALSCGDANPPVEEQPAREFPARDYCDCMFLNCHDLYHDIWGEEELGAREECLREAEATPLEGVPAVSGDSIECRLHYCEEEPMRSCRTAAVQDAVCR